MNRRLLLHIGWLASIILLCTAGPGRAQLQSPEQQKCIVLANKAGGKVAKTQSKETQVCLKLAHSNKLGALAIDAQDCLTGDVRGKVAKPKAKTLATIAGKCPVTPDFAFTDATTINDAASNEFILITSSIFGFDLQAAVDNVSSSVDAVCQRAVQKAYDKIALTELKAFTKCKKDALKKGGAMSAADITNCFNAIDPITNKKVSNAVKKLGTTITKKCPGVNLNLLFPGLCPAPDAATFQDCVQQRVECGACTLLANADNLKADCDSFDNGILDFSCFSYCDTGADCSSGVCSAGVCQPPSCSDGLQNGDESDVDCGGSCPACPIGGSCVIGGDCTTGICEGSVCTCGDEVFTFNINSNTGGLFDSAEWPGGSETQVSAPGCDVSVNFPTGNIDLVGALGDHYDITGFSGFASCFGTGGPDGDGCQLGTCPPLGISTCEAVRPSCSAALNGSATSSFVVQCND